MIRGDVITVQIHEKDWPVEFKDIVKVSFSVDGEVIPVGTWRVNIVKEGGIIEAVPYEVQGKPSIGMDAHVVSRERPKVTRKTGEKEGRGARGKGWLGVVIRNLTPEEGKSLNLSQTEGILVENVTPDSPADKGGLRPGDVFLVIDGRRIFSAEDVAKIVSNGPPGKLLSIEFIRKGEGRLTRVKLEEKPVRN
jgi:S1-C subfamily serine protease